MTPAAPYRRVIIVVLDGLRPDAIARFELPTLSRLLDVSAATLDAQTVTPSVTAAAMTSLFTGVRPAVHGVESDRFHIPSPKRRLMPLTRAVADAGLPVSVHLAEIPFVFRGLAKRFAAAAGVREASFAGEGALGIVTAARETLARQRHGLVILHWPDADRAGHQYGWMSAPYAAAALELDQALGQLVAQCEIGRDPGTLLLVLADHGGGGAVSNDHDSMHPLDQTIPILAMGAGVLPGVLDEGTTLLDVPATAIWALGQPQPAGWSGRPLLEAFQRVEVAA